MVHAPFISDVDHAATRPALGVVFVTFDSAPRIERFLAPLLANIAAACPWAKAVVVDNGSSDGTLELLQRLCPDALVVSLGRNAGFAAACNRGAAAVGAEWLLFCNDDLEMDVGSLRALWAARSGEACVVPIVRGPEGGIQNSTSARWTRWDLKLEFHQVERSRVAFPLGCALLLSTALFERVGGFDERFVPAYYEDAALGIAIWRSGASVEVVATARATHHTQGGAPSPERLAVVQACIYRNRWIFAASALSGRRRWACLAAALPRTLAESLRRRSPGPVLGFLRSVPQVLAAIRSPRPAKTISESTLLSVIEGRP